MTPLDEALATSPEKREHAKRIIEHGARVKALIATRCPVRPDDVQLWDARMLDDVHQQFDREFRRQRAANDTE